MLPSEPSSLKTLVDEYEARGCERRDSALGIQNMPQGYALMLDADRIYYFWLRHDGAEGPVCWDKWWVRRGAFANADHLAKQQEHSDAL
jgi:hypothetical protein